MIFKKYNDIIILINIIKIWHILIKCILLFYFILKLVKNILSYNIKIIVEEFKIKIQIIEIKNYN